MTDHFLMEARLKFCGWIEECREDGGCEKCVEGE